MRPPVLRFRLDPDELVVDNFAGGGGASTGIEAAVGRPIDIAINHDEEAIAMHRANHPETRHYCEDIFEVDPREACRGRRVGLAWFSPDCVHFSRAKGAQPLKKEIRGLAWVVIRWASTVKPRVIILENVEEFETWGPLGEDNRPDPKRIGHTFRQWLGRLSSCGYTIEFQSLVAADYGSPTTRKRLYLIARRDGCAPVWPAPSHGEGREQPWRSAAEIIDWSLPAPSIFERKRPIVESTLRRIAAGIRRYVVETATPFIIPLTHHGDYRVHGIDEPMRTITGAHRGEFALVNPFIVRHGHYSTRTGAGLEPGRGAGTFRGQPLRRPLATVCATNDKHLVVPVLARRGKRQALAASFITKYYGTNVGASLYAPLPTVTANGRGGGHLAEVRAFLIKYYGASSQQQGLRDPLHTITAKARFGLIEVLGVSYQIVDIGMRMLAPHELFAAQGFPVDYNIAPNIFGDPITKTAQIRLAGNSVCPQVAEALVAANLAGGAGRRAA